MPITSDEKDVVYLCDYKKRGMCAGSPWCVGNGGPCSSTMRIEYAVLSDNGEPVLQDDPWSREVSE